MSRNNTPRSFTDRGSGSVSTKYGAVVLDKQTARCIGGGRWAVDAQMDKPQEWQAELVAVRNLATGNNSTARVDIMQVDGKQFMRISIMCGVQSASHTNQNRAVKFAVDLLDRLKQDFAPAGSKKAVRASFVSDLLDPCSDLSRARNARLQRMLERRKQLLGQQTA